MLYNPPKCRTALDEIAADTDEMETQITLEKATWRWVAWSSSAQVEGWERGEANDAGQAASRRCRAWQRHSQM
jgi:hypothetical protein